MTLELKNLVLSNFDFTNLESEFVENINYDSDTDLSVLPINLNISNQDLIDFNNRNINPNNVNAIITICDYFLVKDVVPFIIKNSTPTFQPYLVDNYEFVKDNKKCKITKYQLPKFMTENFKSSKYDLNEKSYISFENRFESFSDEMAYYGVIKWIQFAIDNKVLDIDDNKSMSGFSAFNNQLDCLEYLHDNNISIYNIMSLNGAAYGNNYQILQFLVDKGYKPDYSTCYHAASCGSLSCLKLAYQKSLSWDFEILTQAARCGSLECMKFAYENGCSFDTTPNDFTSCDHDTEFACETAVLSGNMECLKFANENGCLLGNSIENAVRCNNIDMLNYIWYNKKEKISDYTIRILSRLAIENKNMEILKFTHQVIKSPLDGREGRDFNINIEVGDETILLVSGYKDSIFLKYLIDNNIKLNDLCLSHAIINNSINCFEYIISLDDEINKGCIDNVKNRECEIAFSKGSYEMLEYLYQKGYKLGSNWNPISSYNSKCWDFVKKHNVTFTKDFNKYDKFWTDDIFILEILYQMKFYWDKDLPAVLAFNGKIEGLKFVHTHGCPWDVNTTINACSLGYSQLFKFCNMYGITSKFNNSFECLKYAISNNCPCNRYCISSAIKVIKNSNQIIEYLYSKNCPIDNYMIDESLNVNNLPALKLFVSYGLKITNDHFLLAIELCQKNTINYFIELKIPLNISLSNKAAGTNDLKIIELLYKNNCPFNQESLIASLEGVNKYHDNLECFKFLHNMGFKLSSDLMKIAITKTKYLIKDSILGYLIINKCPEYKEILKNEILVTKCININSIIYFLKSEKIQIDGIDLDKIDTNQNINTNDNPFDY